MGVSAISEKNSHLRKPDQFYVTDSQMRLLNVAIALLNSFIEPN